MLEKGVNPKKIARVKTWIQSSYAENSEWRIFAMDSYWMCPFCGEMALEVGAHEDVPEQVFKHLSKKCPAWTSEVTESHFTYDELKPKALSIQIRYAIRKDPLWHMRDSLETWYCPYCGKTTDITYPKGKVTEEFAANVERHVVACYFFEQGKGKPKSPAYMRKVIGRAETINRILELVRKQLSSNPVWMIKDPEGRWICPYCREVVLHIDISTGFLIGQTAPHQIAQHLVESCLPFQEMKEPVASVKELRAHLASSPVASTPLTVLSEEALLQKMKGEMEAVTSPQHVDLEPAATAKRVSAPPRPRPTPPSAPPHTAKTPSFLAAVPSLPTPPKIKGFEFEYMYLPHPTPKGDFSQFIEVSDHHIGILIGDVVGQTPTPAVLANIAKKAVEVRGKWNSSAKNSLVLANEDICATSLEKGIHLTALYAVLNTRRRTLKCALAGHEPLILYNANRNEPPYLIRPKGMVLGLEKGKIFESSVEEVETKLMPGDMILCYTDGVTKTKSPDGKRVTTEILMTLVSKYGRHEAKYLLYAVRETLAKVRQHIPQEDDITLMAVKVQ